MVSSLLFPGAAVGRCWAGSWPTCWAARAACWSAPGLFLVGALACAIAPNVEVMVVARIMLGLGVGAAAATCPLYLAEMAPVDRRGRMVTINELMIVTGQMLAFVMNAVLDQLINDPHVWRCMLGIAAVPAVALFIGMFFLPDSPRWYARQGSPGRHPAGAEPEPRRGRSRRGIQHHRRARQAGHGRGQGRRTA